MAHAVTAGQLDALRWSKRVFVVFADDAGLIERQLSALPKRELAERDMVLLVVPSRGEVSVGAGKLEDIPSSISLRQRFRVASDSPFVAVLVGKDGGVKARKTQPVSAEALFGLIDSMPMRRQEMRTQDR